MAPLDTEIPVPLAGQAPPVLVAGLPSSPPFVRELAALGNSAGRDLRILAETERLGGEDLYRLETGTGEPLSAPGVLDAQWERPPFFMAVRLAHYSASSAGARIVDGAVIGTRGTRAVILDRLARAAGLLLRGALSGTAQGGVAEFPPPPRTWHWQGANKAEGNLRHILQRMRDRLLVEWWGIGLAERSPREMLAAGELGRVRWLTPGKCAAYLADPFPWPDDRRLLCEEMPIAGGHGRIVALDFEAGDRVVHCRPVLESAHHHSYPCAFRHGGTTWLLPEAPVRGGTVLYRLTAAGPVPACDIAPSRQLADPTFFEHDGLCWIACTDLDIGAHDNLCMFYAESPLGPWEPHVRTPVKLDIRGARPAGTPFRAAGQLIRPAQDCARTYGAAITLQRVTRLTPTEYREESVLSIRPDAAVFPDGLHTLSTDGTRTWVDGKRYVFDAATLFDRVCRRQLRRRARRS